MPQEETCRVELGLSNHILVIMTCTTQTINWKLHEVENDIILVAIRSF